VCVRILALVIRYAKRMRHIVLPSVACEAVLYFPTDFINVTTFGIKKGILHKMQVGKELPNLHTRRPHTQSDIYQTLY
jgi:hypothetical protein